MGFRQLPAAARAYILSICGLAVLLVAGSWWLMTGGDPNIVQSWPWTMFLVLTPAAMIAHSFPVSTPGKQAYYVSRPFFTAAVILLTPPQVALLLLLVHVAEFARKRRSGIAQIFNVATYVLTAFVAEALYRALWEKPERPLIDLSQPECLLAGAAAIVAFGFVNRALVSLVIWLGNGIPPREQHMFEVENLITDAVLLAMGLPMAHLAQLAAWAVALGAAPLFLIHRALDLPNLRAQRRQDGLTELFTAQYLAEVCARELSRSQRYGHPVSLLLLDIDLLGKINAEYGQQAADAIIQGAARLIDRVKRDYDVAARLGGGAFAVLLPETDQISAEQQAEQLRVTLAERRHDVASSIDPISITASIGLVVSIDGGHSFEELFAAAERALAQAKSDGRNRVRIAAGLPGAAPAVQLAAPAALAALPDAATEPPENETAALSRSTAAPTSAPTAAPSVSLPRRPTAWWARPEFLSRLLGVVVGGAAMALAWTTLPQMLALDPLTVVLFVIGVIVAEGSSIDLFDRSSYSIAIVPILASGMLLGVPGAIVITGLNALVRGFRRRSRWYKLLFNTGNQVLVAAAATALFQRLSGPLTPADLPWLLLPCALAGATYYLHTVVVAIGMASELRANPLRLWAEHFRWLLPHYLVLSVMGLLLAVAYGVFGPLGAAAFCVPPVMMRYVAKQYMDRTMDNVRRLRTLNERLEHQAFHDPLTDLPNRAMFMNRLERALGEAEVGQLAVLFLDLDNFKIVNDSLGHHVGDALLISVAERLQTCVRPSDTIARLGGDEFTMLLVGLADDEAAVRVAERVAEQLQVPFVLQGQEVWVTASIGVLLHAADYGRADDLLRDADVAMYRAKTCGKARYEVFDRSMSSRASERLQLETDLRYGIERREFVLNYQPVIDLESGQITGVEALVRWRHPQRGLITPDSFIPLAEETGMIVPIGQWVLHEACVQAQQWQLEHPDQALVVSVNLSARQLQEPSLLGDVERILKMSGLAPGSLELEITESVAMQDADSTILRLRQLKDLGLQIAIDDFGTGYSSLAYLNRFPIDRLKIDRSFVARLGGTDPEDRAVVRTIIALAKTLHLGVTAEGIETAQQQLQLRGEGCDYGQGYYLARPLTSDAIARLLTESDDVGVVEPLAA